MKSIIIYITLFILLLSNVDTKRVSNQKMKSKFHYSPNSNEQEFEDFITSVGFRFSYLIGRGKVKLELKKSDQCKMKEISYKIYSLYREFVQTDADRLKLKDIPPKVDSCDRRHEICIEFLNHKIDVTKKQLQSIKKYKSKDNIHVYNMEIEDLEKRINLYERDKRFERVNAPLFGLFGGRSVSSMTEAINVPKKLFPEDFVNIARLLLPCFNFEEYLEDHFGKLDGKKGEIFPTLVKRGFEMMQQDIKFLMFCSYIREFIMTNRADQAGSIFGSMLGYLVLDPITYDKN